MTGVRVADRARGYPVETFSWRGAELGNGLLDLAAAAYPLRASGHHMVGTTTHHLPNGLDAGCREGTSFVTPGIPPKVPVSRGGCASTGGDETGCVKSG